MSPKEIFSQFSLWIVNLHLKSSTFCLYFVHKAPEYGSGSTILVVTKDLTSGGGLSNGIWSKHGLRSLHLPIQANNLDVDSPHGACFSMIVCVWGGGGEFACCQIALIFRNIAN